MAAQKGLLAALVALLCTYTTVYGAERCSGFRHLENGRTFFRYGGLLVIFRCHPGYKLHGYQTNSCMSGHWTREPPVCVGSGCPSPGPLVNGASSLNEDGSWVVFSCNSGYRLHGPSMLYCKGHTWNTTKPVCKESDMMRSVQKPNIQQNPQNLQAALVLKNQEQSHYDTLANIPSKEVYLKSHMPSQTSNSEEVKVTDEKVLLKYGVQTLQAQFQKGIEAPVTKSGREEGSMRQRSMGPDKETGRTGSVAKASFEEEEVDRGIQASQMLLIPVTTASHVSPTVSSTLSLPSGAQVSTSAAAAAFSTARTSVATAVTATTIKRTPATETVTSLPTQASTSALPVLGGEKVLEYGHQRSVSVPNTSQDYVTHPGIVTGSSTPAGKTPQAETVFGYPSSAKGPRQRDSPGDSAQGQQPGSEGEEELTATTLSHPGQSMTEPPDPISIKHQATSTGLKQAYTSPYTLSTSTSFSSVLALSSTSSPPLTPSFSFSASSLAHPSPIPLASFSASTPSNHSTTKSNAKTPPPVVTPPSRASTPTERRPYWTEYHNVITTVTVKPPTLTLSRRPVCPYPPVPAHGTFYFRNVENPGPREYRHYIQYACYPGYTLAHGDIHSYCQQGGTWSGVTPFCLELTPCSVNNGGCSQLCSHSHNYSQSYRQTQCHCRPGFALLDDRRTCRDLDECVEGQHQCQQKCVNTFGSFKCSCNDGYHLAHDQTSCTDVNECLLPVAVTGCLFGCVNTPGSFHCQCPSGYSLQTVDGHCQDIDECAVNQGRGPCMEQCHNSPGFYQCSCMHGHILAGDGWSCIPQCPPGYRKQPLTPTPDNSTTQALRECVDINECQEETLQLSRCEWQCINLPGSHRCICPRGYTLQRDGQHCKDINECSRNNGGCSHLCVNHKGGYKCACPLSHRFSPYSWKECVPRKTLNTAELVGNLP